MTDDIKTHVLYGFSIIYVSFN